jgi:threonine dehydrogenase-like Zn-dependent dehydrogenase
MEVSLIGLARDSAVARVERTKWNALVKLARPYQWIKNGPVFAALVFSQRLFHFHDVVLTVLAFIAFCAIASAGFQEGDAVVVECIQSCDACPQCQRKNWIGCADRRELGVLRAQGAYARFVVVLNRFVHKLPQEVDLARAALCEPLAVVLKGIDRLSRTWHGNGANKSCAVVGAGPLGRLCPLVLAHLGHCATVFDRDSGRLADLNHLAISTANSLERLADFDAVIEATGDPSALATILSQSGVGSTTLLMGLPYARQEFNFETVVACDKAVIGSVGSSSEHFTRAIELLHGSR